VAHKPALHPDVERLATAELCDRLFELSDAFVPMPHGLKDTQLWENVQDKTWASGNMWLTAEFVRTVDCVEGGLDNFLRPPKWIVQLSRGNSYVGSVLLSPFEANELLSHFSSRPVRLGDQTGDTLRTSLHMLAPRRYHGQHILYCEPALVAGGAPAGQ
jgi:hypothetical protein